MAEYFTYSGIAGGIILLALIWLVFLRNRGGRVAEDKAELKTNRQIERDEKRGIQIDLDIRKCARQLLDIYGEIEKKSQKPRDLASARAPILNTIATRLEYLIQKNYNDAQEKVLLSQTIEQNEHYLSYLNSSGRKVNKLVGQIQSLLQRISEYVKIQKTLDQEEERLAAKNLRSIETKEGRQVIKN